MEEQNLDDLFGDDALNEPLNEEQIQQQLDNVQSVPPPPGLAERVDQLRLNGCNDRIAWSRIGSIAYITKDRREVRICTMRFRNDKGGWEKHEYTDYTFLPYFRQAFKGRELAHVSWSPGSTELFVADVCGRIALFTVAIALNRAFTIKIYADAQDDSLNGLVGLTWLSQKRPLRVSRGATKTGDAWKPNLSSSNPRGLSYPTINPGSSQKSAFLAVNRRGTLICGYSALDSNVWAEIKHDLDGFSSSADLLTHAVLCPDADENSLLVVHTASKKLRLYSISIEWHTTKPQGSNERPAPTITSQHLTTVDSCRPSTDAHWSFAIPELSRLEIIPRSSLEKTESTHPTIVAAFTGEGIGGGEPTHTIISRWELHETVPTVDASFSQLSSKRNATTELKPEKRLHRLDDMRVDRVLLQISFQQHNDNFILTSSDGGVEFRDRKLEMLSMEENPDQVGGIPQLGFSLSNQKPCLHTALSPNSVLKASMGREHELEIAVMQLPVEMVDLGGVATLEKVAMTFAITNAIAEASMTGNSTTDDLIMAFCQFAAQLPDEQQQALRSMFLRETYKILSAADKLVDTAQFERSVKGGMILRCWSLQAALGNFGDKLNRNLPSKIAMTALNIRHIYVAFMLALLPVQRPNQANGTTTATPSQPEPDLNRADVLEYIDHLSAWYLKLQDHAMGVLFALNRALDASNHLDPDALRHHIAASNDPSLILLCGQFTRTLFRHSSNYLSRLAASAKRAPYIQPPSPTAPHWEAFGRTCRSVTVPPPVLDSLLAEFDERIGRAVADAGFSDAQRQDMELELMTRGMLPDVLLQPAGPVAWLLGAALKGLRAGTVVITERLQPVQPTLEAHLAFADGTVLGLGDDARTRRWRETTLFDGLQKKKLDRTKAGTGAGDLRVRSCTRCGMSMEDILVRGKGAAGGAWNHAVFHSLRLCVCNAHFITEKTEDVRNAR